MPTYSLNKIETLKTERTSRTVAYFGCVTMSLFTFKHRQNLSSETDCTGRCAILFDSCHSCMV